MRVRASVRASIVWVLGLAFVAALPARLANAVSFTQLIAFGDSLTDTGAPTSSPYAAGRYSNGPVWIDGVASGLGLSSLSSDSGGTNYAVGGAQSAHMIAQAAGYLGAVSGAADPTGLYVVWGGGNDGLGGVSPLVAADNIAQVILNLQAAGAQYFLVPNLPNLALTPAAAGSPLASAFTNAFNAALSAELAAISGVTIYGMDVYTRTNDLVANPGDFGFTNVATPCFTGAACATPSTYAWWDTVHPTTAAHAGLAEMALEAVPEVTVTSSLLVALGAGGLVARRRRAARAAALRGEF